jgi:hypothetical protein
MPPTPPKLLPVTQGPRLIVYHQTIHNHAGNYHSLLPLLTNNTGITHIIVAAIHINDGPGNITLNDHTPDDKRFEQLWGEVKWLQGSGVKVLGMLGVCPSHSTYNSMLTQYRVRRRAALSG